MRVLIQNPENLLYLESINSWSPHVENAFDFSNSDNAMAYCATHAIAPARVVLRWEGLPHSITLSAFPTKKAARLLRGEQA